MNFFKNNIKLILELIILLYFFLIKRYDLVIILFALIVLIDFKYLKKRIILFIILIIFSLTYICFYQNYFFQTNIKENDTIQIKITNKIEINEKYIKFEGKYKHKNYQILYFNIDDKQDFKYGDIYQIKIDKINKIENQFHNKSSFDSVLYYKSKKIRYQITTKDIKKIKSKTNILYKLKNKREKQIKKVEKVLPKNSYLINSLVFGKKIEDEEIYNKIKYIGIIQLFTISGLHISFLIVVIEYILKIFKIQKKHINIIISFILIFYIPLSGGGSSVKRSVMMFLIYSYFYLKEKDILKIYVLLISLLFFLIINPFNLLNIGFILTYLISFYLILNRDFFLNKNKKEEIYFNYFISMFIFPITTNLNNRFNILLPFLLIIYNRLIYIMLFLSFLIVICINLKFKIILIFLKLVFNLISLLFLLLNNLSMIGIIKIHHLNFILIIIYMYLYIVQLKEYYIFKDKINKNKIKFLIFTIIISLNINLIGTVDIIDIGQGDAIYIQKPLSYNILIDTGPKKSEKELMKFLDYKGVNKIDNLIITHNHEDHQGALSSIIKNYNIKKIYLNQNTYDTFKDLLKKENYKIINGIYKNKLGYFYTSKNNYQEENNNSIIFLTKLGLNKWLFMGDAEKELESEIINKFDLDIDYLKIGHHGSKTSTTQSLLENTSPKEVFISSGRNNKYNHPNKEVINRLNKNNIKNKDTQFDYQITKYYI